MMETEQILTLILPISTEKAYRFELLLFRNEQGQRCASFFIKHDQTFTIASPPKELQAWVDDLAELLARINRTLVVPAKPTIH